MVTIRKFFLIPVILINSYGLHAQNTYTIDRGIELHNNYLLQRLEVNAVVAIINIQSNYPDLSDYIITKLTTNLVNSNRYIVIDRRNIEVIEHELNFNMSGSVSDETAQNIGKMIGAKNIIFGSFTPVGDIFRLTIQILEVETAIISGMFDCLLIEDPILLALIGRKTDLSQSLRRNKNNSTFYWIYFGIRPSFGLHFYNTKDTIFNENNIYYNGSFDITAQLTIRPFQYFGLQIEGIFTVDSMECQKREFVYDSNNTLKYYYDTYYTFDSYSLLLPILFRGIFDYNMFTISGLAGIYINLPLGRMEQKDTFLNKAIRGDMNNLLGFMTGANFGFKLGRGNLFIDIRYAVDFSNTTYDDIDLYHRSMVFFGLGYEFALLKNNRSNNQ